MSSRAGRAGTGRRRCGRGRTLGCHGAAPGIWYSQLRWLCSLGKVLSAFMTALMDDGTLFTSGYTQYLWSSQGMGLRSFILVLSAYLASLGSGCAPCSRTSLLIWLLSELLVLSWMMDPLNGSGTLVLSGYTRGLWYSRLSWIRFNKLVLSFSMATLRACGTLVFHGY